MKINGGFALREVAGNILAVSVGNGKDGFNGVINLSESSAFLWKILEKGAEEDELVKALLEEYNVDEETAKKDVAEFIVKLKEAKLLK